MFSGPYTDADLGLLVQVGIAPSLETARSEFARNLRAGMPEKPTGKHHPRLWELKLCCWRAQRDCRARRDHLSSLAV